MPKKDKEKDKDAEKESKKEEEKKSSSKSTSDSDSSSSKGDSDKETSKKDNDSDDIRKKIKTEVVSKEEKDKVDKEDKEDSKEKDKTKDSDDKSNKTADKKTDKSSEESKTEEKSEPEKPLPTVPSFSMLDQKTNMEDSPESDSDAKEETGEKDGDKKPESKKDDEISSDEVKEWLKDVRPDTSKESHKGGKPTMKIVLIILMGLAILAAVVGGIFYYRQGVTVQDEPQDQEGTQVLPTSPPTTPSPTPEEATSAADLSEYSVNVLNGSGVAGEAGTVADLLENAGFEGVDAGNADSYDYTDTEVQTKEDTPDAVYESIEDALSDEYVVVRSETALDEDSEYDAVVTVGSSSPEGE